MKKATHKDSGMDLQSAINSMEKNERVVFGSRSKKYHIINNDDRDYNAPHAMNKVQCLELMGVNLIENAKNSKKLKIIAF